jgi:hypothetical protein
MPIGRFAGSIFKDIPFLGDAYNTAKKKPAETAVTLLAPTLEVLKAVRPRDMLKLLPFLGDIYNTYNEYKDQRSVGFSHDKSFNRALPVGVTGALTNLIDPIGISNLAPNALRALAKARRYEEEKGNATKIFGSPIISRTDPRMFTPGVIGVGQLFEDSKALEDAARMADWFNSEAHARTFVDRLDPQTKDLPTSLAIDERLRQLKQKINPQ